jgi:hypothetical protein
LYQIVPGLGDHTRAIVRPDLALIGLDDGVERGRINVALLGQHRLQGAHAQLGLGKFRAVLVIIVVMIVLGHGAPSAHRVVI